MEIKKELSLNKHPKDCAPYSLIAAKNVKVSNDGSVLVNEEGLKDCDVIADAIRGSGITNYKIVGVISTSHELVLFVLDVDSNKSSIFRYTESRNDNSAKCIKVNSKWKYSNGKIKGTYTYNVENHLIISIAEYDADKDVPLKTIDLDDPYSEDELSDDDYSVVPKITLPSWFTFGYAPGASYKGFYFVFYRKKIDKVNYTKWYSIGNPIFNDVIIPQQINRICFAKSMVVDPKNATDGYSYGNTDSFSDTKDICNQTIRIRAGLSGITFQYGFIICTKDKTLAFRTNDLTNSAFTFDKNVLIEYSVNEFTTDYYNYFNVGNIINYKNRVYIANYNERNANDDEFSEAIEDNITLTLYNKYMSGYYADARNNGTGIIPEGPFFKMASFHFGTNTDNTNTNGEKDNSISNQYPMRLFHAPLGIVIEGVFAHDFLKVSYDTIIKVGANANTAKEYYAYNCIICPKSYNSTENGGSTNTTFTVPDGIKVVCLTNDFVPTIDQTFESGVCYLNGVIINFDKSQIRITHNIIEPSYDFEIRKEEDTLIPGEVYNFFIHFVDEYGNSTNGYRISNNQSFKDPYTGEFATVFKILWNNNGNGFIPYWFTVANSFNIKLLTGHGSTIPYVANKTINVYTDYPSRAGYRIETNSGGYLEATNRDDLYDLIYHTFTAFINNDKIDEIYPYQVVNNGTYTHVNNTIAYNYGYGESEATFGYYENEKGERLFRIPDIDYNCNDYMLGETHVADLNGMGNMFNKFYITAKISTELRSLMERKGYRGWFISYEKSEHLRRYTGILTRSDFFNMTAFDNITDGNTELDFGSMANNLMSNKCYLYSSRFDIDDAIKFDFNIIRLDCRATFDKVIKKNDVIDMNYSTTYNYSYNMAMTGRYTINEYFPISDYKLVVADSVKDNRVGKGTALEMDDYKSSLISSKLPLKNEAEELLDVSYKIDADNIYIATVMNMTRNIYMNTDKELIRLSEVSYNNSNFINYGYDGRMTYDGVLVYNNAGVILNEGDNKLYRPNGNEYYSKDKHCWYDIPFMQYIQFPLYSDKLFESKQFNNAPQNIAFSIKEETDRKSVAFGTFVQPKNSVDLFKDPIGEVTQYAPKLLTNYRDDVLRVDRFDKTIRRSNVIQSESRKNAWREFPVEGYKDITENKGIITNLVGIGYYLLTHTEHSLFMFDVSASLKTQDKDVQLYQPDAFEVDYKEVFTSDKGYGGLQDDLAYVIGEFGYIFYNDDFHTIYQFDNGQLKLLGEDIILWLDKYKPKNVRFAHDKYNNRLLIKFDYSYNNATPRRGSDNAIAYNEVISFNYKEANFISLHDYYFTQAFNTKTECYFQTAHNNDKLNCPLHIFEHEINYGHFDTNMSVDSNSLYLTDKTDDIYNSYIDIIVTEQFDLIKFLEYIKYRVRKIHIPFYSENINNPVDARKHPYAGDILRIFNEENDSGDLDISITNINQFNKFKKPWYENTRWNFNYFRNSIKDHPATPSDKLRRLFGNYFVIRFIFKNTDNLRIEFESLECALSLFRSK